MVGPSNVAYLVVLCFWAGAMQAAETGKKVDKKPAEAVVVDDSLDPQGRPKNFVEGRSSQLAIWFDDGQWHVRATSSPNRDVITGRITIHNGVITDATSQGLDLLPHKSDKKEADQRRFAVRQRQRRENNADRIVPHPRNTGFDFKFVLFGKIDGLDFKVSDGADAITVEANFGGDNNPNQVLIGGRGAHPQKLPVSVSAHPDQPSHKR